MVSIELGKASIELQKARKKLLKYLSNPKDVQFYPSMSANRLFPIWYYVQVSLRSAFLSNYPEKKIK